MNSNLKGFLLKNKFFKTIVQGGKNPICEKKSKKANNFFVTKATDLKTLFLKKPLKNARRNMCHTLIFVLN